MGVQAGIELNKRYRLVALLAEGGMARVFLADDLLLSRRVAVKVLREQYAGDSAFLERFQMEARAAGGLAHPNIVSVYDVGAEGGTNYIVMELIEGPNLKQIIQRDGQFNPAQAIDITIELLAALSFAHEHGIVHRDVKPQNILVTSQGHTKVTDFGIARAASGSQLTETGLVMGSVHYCAPEQALGKGSTQSSDVYSVGVVLYEMLTAQVPFDSDNALGVALKHVQEPPPPPRQFNPHLSPALESIVLKAMAKDPADRFPDAESMTQALQAYRRFGEQGTMPFVAVSPRDVAQAAHVEVGRGGSKAAVSPAAHAPKRGTFDWLVVVFSLLILAMIAGWIPLAARLYDLYLRPGPVPTRGTEPSPAAVAVTQPYEPTPVVTASRTAQPTANPTAKPPTVPSLVGLMYTQAERQLEVLGLRMSMAEQENDTFPVGVVVTQTVAPGYPLAAGATVGVLVSKGGKPPRMPNVVELTLVEARSRLEPLGLKVSSADQWDDRLAAGRVIAQSPISDTVVISGTVASLTISKGRAPAPPSPLPFATTPPPTPIPPIVAVQPFVVPDVIGLPEAEARQWIAAAKLATTYTNYQEIDTVDPSQRDFFATIPVGSVVSVDPRPGTLTQPGWIVRIAVRKK